MAREIAIDRFGGPEVLQPRVVPDTAPGPGEVRIRQTAIGVNFTDVHGRRGDYAPLRAMPLPLVLGIEAAGVVEAVGEGVERFRIGDSLFGYSYDTQKVPLADAVASSAGFPGLIGPLVFDTRPYQWFRYKDRSKILVDPETQRQRKTEPFTPDFPIVHLWDGGVYDNHGLEGLHDFIHGWREDIEFFIISDGAGRARPERYSRGIKALMRISTGIMMDQVRSLRSRAIVERLINHDDLGAFLQAGNSSRYILSQAKLPQVEIDNICADSMTDEDVKLAAEMPTVIRKLTEVEFERLFRHGFEVADHTLYGYHPEIFTHMSFSQARSSARIRST